MSANNENIRNAVVAAIKPVYDAFKVLNDEYVNAMSTTGGYDVVSDGILTKNISGKVSGFVLSNPDHDDDGLFMSIKEALKAGHIEEQTVEKSTALKNAEAELISEYNDIIDGVNEVLLPYQFKGKKTRSGKTSTGDAGESKQAEVVSTIKRIDPEAVITFNGRRFTARLHNGKIADYDVYGQSWADSIRKMV
jgi:hypothetical protein